jgi:ABC-type antimicrobial peptide transport system permease subunit
VVIGMGGYHLLLYGASKVVPKLAFNWVVDWSALTLSLVSTLTVGLLSGLFPAVKAEKLQVIEALRSE